MDEARCRRLCPFLFQEGEVYDTYEGSITPCARERHRPKKDMPLEPPPIKIGHGRPRRNRRKDSHEDPKKAGRLTRHRSQMVCNNYKGVGHNKKGCPKPAQSTDSQPPP